MSVKWGTHVGNKVAIKLGLIVSPAETKLKLDSKP
jgi:hypothetical protein